jgi:hypothetical protein
MARVYNDTKFTLTCNHIHKVIHAGKFALCSDKQARLVPQNGQFRVEFDDPQAGEAGITKEPATRKRVTRGAKSVEVTAPPKAEVRSEHDDTVWF